ncbi:unnamed protein product [Brugia pahangi]|uniref:Secreted protein n=1 Tax=Brugia pahangi TaxID=6280 RepID=A0A0N4TYQ3_BRUPA|nr:unnamed protein product [Brugia pahangi]
MHRSINEISSLIPRVSLAFLFLPLKCQGKLLTSGRIRSAYDRIFCPRQNFPSLEARRFLQYAGSNLTVSLGVVGSVVSGSSNSGVSCGMVICFDLGTK